MTFEEFQKTGRDVEDVSDYSEEDIYMGPGRIYLNGLIIEQVDGGWSLTIGNCQWIINDLVRLERELYGFAVSAGWTEGK